MSGQGTIKLTWTDEEGEEITHTFQSVNEVCDDCEGYGTVMNESMREHGYTPEEMREDFDDEERAEYFKRGGIYDVQCPTCHGNKVVAVVAENLLRDQAEKDLYKSYQDSCERSARYEAEDRATRRMEEGYRE